MLTSIHINYKLLARAVSSKEAVSVMPATFSGNVQSSLMSIQVHYYEHTGRLLTAVKWNLVHMTVDHSCD